MPKEIDTTNKFLVAATGDKFIIMNPPRGPISGDDALLLAAWLVAIADRSSEGFADVLTAVSNT